ncbi:hypothetical protein WJX72_005324 [[Myrmecia] bisecta]|uniref:Uncharacterized protein n=1 Tax=[Myrmecia] bisecta TaxID=41462 RepID=A0AAW1Q6A0_9CHLO
MDQRAWISGPGGPCDFQDLDAGLGGLGGNPGFDDFDFGSFMTNLDSWDGAADVAESGAMGKARSMAWPDTLTEGLPSYPGSIEVPGLDAFFNSVDFSLLAASADPAQRADSSLAASSKDSKPATLPAWSQADRETHEAPSSSQREKRRRNLEAAFNGASQGAAGVPVQQDSQAPQGRQSQDSQGRPSLDLEPENIAAAVKPRGRCGRCRKPRELPDMVPINDVLDLPAVETPVKLAASPPTSYPRFGGVVKRKTRTPAVAFCTTLSPFSIIKSDKTSGGISIAELNSKIEASAAAASSESCTLNSKGPKTLKLTPGGMPVAMVPTPRKTPTKSPCLPDDGVVLNRIDKSTKLVAV